MCHQENESPAMAIIFSDIINLFENEWLRQENNFGKEGTCGYF